MKKNMIIVGAGLAGLSAALQAVKEGCSVKLISSLPSERAQSVMAEGGINAALNTKGEDDSTQEHYEDTIKAGCNLADPNAVWNMTQAAPEVVKWLHSIGVQFNTCGYDELDLRNFGGQKKKRTAFAKSDIGKQIMTAMIDAVRRLEVQGQIERFEHHSFRTLLMTANICHGCVVCDNYTGEIKMLYADAVIVASGGMHGLFGNTTGSLANTGEVSASLFSAGVPMANLEMIQYHPTTVEIGGKKMLISEAARGEGGRLFTYRDGNRWYFMEEKYPELGNLMPRDVVSREEWKLMAEGYQIWLDIRGLDADIYKNRLRGVVDACQTFLGLDPTKKSIPIAPGIHYFMGGIRVDREHRTAVRGLYAAGECACQYHGANRLGGNSLLGALYGGQKAAESAVFDLTMEEEAEDYRHVLNRTGEESLSNSGKVSEQRNVPGVFKSENENAADRMKKLQSILRESLGIIRDEKELQSGLEAVRKLSESVKEKDEADTLILENKRFKDSCLLGEAMLLSALNRKESRGAHQRSDYPEELQAYQKTTLARYTKDGIQISFEAIDESNGGSEAWR